VRPRLEARARHEGFPFGAVGADVSPVELAGREVGHLVAEDFLEEPVGGGFEVRGDADEASVGIAAAEASGEARAPLDAAFGLEVGDVPEAKPAVEGLAKGIGEAGRRGHGREG